MDAGEEDVVKIQEAVNKLEEINEVQDVYLNISEAQP
jgi:transcriptional/translational regulatory protein YebC/TACO1